MDFKNLKPKYSTEISLDDIPDDTLNFTHQLVTQIVAENDERTMLMIEEYVKNKHAEGEIIASRIIPEGRLRHIINLGLTRYAAQEHIDLKPGDMFPQEQYIEYLRRELMLSQQQVYNLEKRNEMLAKMCGLISEDTELD